MKTYIISILLLVIALNVFAESSETVEMTADRADGSKINYYLVKKLKEEQSDSLLLVLQGSDCNSVLNIKSIFTDIKNVWSSADLLLIEKYGIQKGLAYSSESERQNCPTSYLKKDNPKQRVRDAETVLDIISKEHTYSKLIVIGGSEGAIIANLLAAENPSIDATISFSGGGRWFMDDVLHSIHSQYKYSDEAKKSIEGFKSFSQQIMDNQPVDIVMSNHGYNWWHQMLLIDQLSTIQKVKTPLLIVQGGIDKSASPKKANEMMSVIQESNKKNVEYLFYKNLDHRFRNSEGQKTIDKVVIDMHTWLNKVLLPSERVSE
jgi:dienelactone hydrolase